MKFDIRYKLIKINIALEIYILSNLEIFLEHLCREYTPEKCINFN